MTLMPPPGAPGAGGLPQRGSFGTSEVLPLIQRASLDLQHARDNWKALREDADRKRDEAKRVRANLIVSLRTWGNDVTGQPIKTSAERQEWANADANVQQAELDADLAQTVQIVARGAYDDAQSSFDVLRSLLAQERDELKREYGGPTAG